MFKSLLLKVFASIAAILAYGWINGILNPVATIMSAKMAGMQFENSDVSYVISVAGMNFFQHLGVPVVILLVILACIWWKTGKKVMGAALDDLENGKPGSSKSTETHLPAVAILAGSLLASSLAFAPAPAQAYYDKSDYAETYFVLPNETAFYIPDVGANKDSQAKLDSEAYFTANKVAAKRFNIPHVKLENSGLFSNFYVPAGRVIIVDRVPYSREWTHHADRGTSVKNEGIECQSKEGINVMTAVSLAAQIEQDNASKYLYSFGVDMPAGNRTDPAVVFTSVYHAKPLTQVMDNFGRIKVQSIICREITKRSFNDVNSQSADIMAKTETDVKAAFAAKGITLDTIGWAGTFTFDHKIQDAINDQFVGSTVGSALPALERQANIDVKRGLAEGLKKGLPSFLPPNMAAWISGMFGSSPAAEAAKK